MGGPAADTLLGHLHGRYWRWDFCTKTCIECDACDNVCPVNLAPRDLMAPIPSPGGFSIDAAPGRNHCLGCGDCARACEWMVGLKGKAPVPLLLGLYTGPQRVDAQGS